MEQAATTQASGETGQGPATVTLRYWAAARSAAGLGEETFLANTIGEVLAAAVAAHAATPRFAQVLRVCSVLHGEQPLGMRDPSAVAVSDGDVIDLLPPFAGGSSDEMRIPVFDTAVMRGVRSRTLAAMVSTYLTKRRAVDNCHTATALCRMP